MPEQTPKKIKITFELELENVAKPIAFLNAVAKEADARAEAGYARGVQEVWRGFAGALRDAAAEARKQGIVR